MGSALSKRKVLLVFAVGAVALISGCQTAVRLDSITNGECRRLMRGDALDRASARRLGCHG